MRALLLLAAVVGCLLAGFTATIQAEAADAPADFSPRRIELQTFSLINQYREQNGLDDLVWNDAIAREARLHSEDMATGASEFGHDGFRDRVDHLKDTFDHVEGAGENVLFTSELTDLSRRAVDMWLRSPHHLKNIRGDFNFSGIGVWQDKNGTVYFTQLFIKNSPVAGTTTETPHVLVVTN